MGWDYRRHLDLTPALFGGLHYYTLMFEWEPAVLPRCACMRSEKMSKQLLAYRPCLITVSVGDTDRCSYE